MRLKTEWRKALKKSRTVKLSAVAATLSSAQIALPYLTDIVPTKALALLAVLATIGAVVARLTHNEETDG